MTSHPTNPALIRSLIATALLFGAAQAFASPAMEPGLLVRLRSGHGVEALDSDLTGSSGRRHASIEKLGVHVLRAPAGKAEALRARLVASGHYDLVEEDAVGNGSFVPNDPNFASQWHLATIAAPTAWDSTTGDDGLIVAMIDSGVDRSHPDLSSKLLPGWDYVNGDSDPTDDNGHGTATAGTVAAIGQNSVGVSGVAMRCRILPLKVLNSSNYGYYSDWANAIIAATDQGARVINLSLGGTTASSTLQSAVDYAWSHGAVVVASAGNAGSSAPLYPAACNNVVAVSATTSSDSMAGWSSYGSHLTVSAPGEGIVTTCSGGGYGAWSGTSFSAPVTSGVVALMAAANPNLTNTQLVSLLKSSSDDLGAVGFDPYYGYGRVNAAKAVAAAQSAPAADVTAPVAAITLPEAVAPIAGTVTVFNDATDNIGVQGLQFTIDGVAVASASGSSLDYTWDTTRATDGTHTLTLRATDTSGNVGTSQMSVKVTNTVSVPDTTAPSIAITSPATGATLGNSVKVTFKATDNVGVVRVELYCDGVLAGTSTSSPFTITWNTRKVTKGSHTLTARATDAAGNSTLSAPVSVKL